MGARLAVSLLLLGGGLACLRRPSPDGLYQRSTTLLHQGKLEEARRAAEAGYRREPSWRFRLLKIDVLLQIDARAALAEIAAAGDPAPGEVRARLELDRGWANYLISNYPAAEAALDRAQELASGAASNPIAAEIELDRGIVLAQQGRYAAAEANLRSALAGIEKSGEPYLRVRALGSLGWFLLFTHHPDQAIYWLESQRDLAARMGAARQVANAQGNLGSAYYRMGDYERALPLFREAEHSFEQLGDRRQQEVWLGNIGNVLLDSGEYAAAIPIYTRAASIAHALEDPFSAAAWEDNLANAYLKLGRYDEAERHNDEALRLKQSIHAPVAFPLVNRAGIAEGRGYYGEAERLYRQVLDGAADDPVPLLEAESGLAGVLVKTGQLAGADAQFRSGIERVERSSATLARDDYKLSYLSSLIDFYQRYVDFLVDRGQVERAAEVAEASRARLLDERLDAARTAARAGTAAAFRRIARSSRAVVLSYWLAPNRSFLWVITPEAVELHVLPPEKEIARRVQSYRAFIENLGDPLASGFADGRQLSGILLGPVRGLLRDGVRLLIAPDGVLNSLNFETLPDPGDPSRYLIGRATVAVAPSLDALAAARPKPARTRGLLLIGDPESAVEEYPRLPNAWREMKMIAGVFGPRALTELGGVQANPAAYRAAAPDRYSWIHFAAHASANRENPLESALILSRHNGVYTLSAREVMEIPLHAELVTLSACRGAGAKTYSGEGLVGLSWAFLRAGAQNVVAGLWDVTDTSTASLMAGFYAEMMRGSAPAEALRAAKLRLAGSAGAYRKPFYWAPFQLYVRAAEQAAALQPPRDSARADDP